MTYLDEIKRGMKLLAESDFYVFGQNTKYGGTSMYHTLTEFPDDHKIETPVFEETQMGMSIGMALTGMNVCSLYPRMDFLILAMNQLINHLDKTEEMSDGQFKPRVIIRTCVGSTKPMMPGPQHMQNYTQALKLMCTNIDVIELNKTEDVYPAYLKAVNSDRSTILIEKSDLYNSDMVDEIHRSKEK